MLKEHHAEEHHAEEHHAEEHHAERRYHIDYPFNKASKLFIQNVHFRN
jgi:hypothetical protein